MSTPQVEVLDLSDPKTSASVLDPQRAAYRVEAELIAFDAIPPLHESLSELMQAELCWVGIRDDNRGIVAALAYTRDGEDLDIDRLVVAPPKFQSGLGAALVESLDATAVVNVSTGAANAPAGRFCESLGFVRTGDEEIVPGLVISHFTRKPRA